MKVKCLKENLFLPINQISIKKKSKKRIFSKMNILDYSKYQINLNNKRLNKFKSIISSKKL